MIKTIINDLSDIPANSKGYIEVVTRLKNGTINAITKYAVLNSSKETMDLLEKANALLNRNNKLMSKATKTISSLKNLQGLNIGLQGVDLCLSSVGFAVVCSKLNDVTSKMDNVIDYMKDKTDIEVNYHMNTIIEEYENMLDIYDRGELPDEENIRKLIAEEYNYIKILLQYLNKNMSKDKTGLLFGIKTLSNMLAVSLCKYDELYYFNHKEKKKNNFHNNHDKWLSIYDELSGKDSIKVFGDYLNLDCKYNQFKTDIILKAWIDDFEAAKKAVEDRDFLITSKEKIEEYHQFLTDINNQALNELQTVIDDSETKEIVKNAAVSLGLLN